MKVKNNLAVFLGAAVSSLWNIVVQSLNLGRIMVIICYIDDDIL